MDPVERRSIGSIFEDSERWRSVLSAAEIFAPGIGPAPWGRPGPSPVWAGGGQGKIDRLPSGSLKEGNMMRHDYYYYSKEQLLAAPRLPITVMEDDAAFFRWISSAIS